MKTTMALGAALLALAACSNEAGSGNEAGTNAQAAAPAGKASGNETIRPGQWESTTQMLAMTVPGQPAGPLPPPQTQRNCISEEESRKLSDTFLQREPGRECSRQEFTMRGGRMEGHLVCTQQGQQSTVDITGQYTRDSFDLTMNVSQAAPGGGPGMQVRMRNTARRLGDCPAGAEQEAGNQTNAQ